MQTTNQLQELQSRVDRFLIEYFYPRYKKRRKYFTKPDLKLLHEKCNFMTISERVDYVVLKEAFKDKFANKLVFSERSVAKKLQIIKPVKFSSEIYRKSLVYRKTILWNGLPTCLDVNKLSYAKFKEWSFEHIVSKRNSIPI